MSKWSSSQPSCGSQIRPKEYSSRSSSVAWTRTEGRASVDMLSSMSPLPAAADERIVICCRIEPPPDEAAPARYQTEPTRQIEVVPNSEPNKAVPNLHSVP